MIKKILLLSVILSSVFAASAEHLYISAKTGNDANPGTQVQPLKTLAEAARRVNTNYKKQATTIELESGIYFLTETVIFNNDHFTAESRLTIKAAVLPDDAGWMPQQMPIITMAIPMVTVKGDGEVAKGIQIEASHVTIEGLKFTGQTTYYYIDGKENRRRYPIYRDGNSLDDLLVTQCVFVGNEDIMPIRVAVIGNGHGLVVDHCVFYGCQNSVVFWNADGSSKRNAMRYCLVYGNNTSGVWTTKSTDGDLEFHHNIIANTKTIWITEGSRPYQAHDCIFTGNALITASGARPEGTKTLDQSPLITQNVQLTGTIEIEKDQGKNNYLQLKSGSFGSDLKAGLFKK